MRTALRAMVFVSILAVAVFHSSAQESVADVVKRSSDAVVLITITNSAAEETKLGSGFLISADGNIVTNYHVIKDAHTANVKLSNGAFFKVNGIIASDVDKDLAIIKVDGRSLPFLQLGDIDNLRVGDHVIAIGSPLGLEGTVSDGIVSALRDVGNMKWIQTTAPVSHGNSGGPLLDMNGHVVGVITWGVNLKLGQNLNFAAPSSEVNEILSAPTHATGFTSEAILPGANTVQRLGDMRTVAVSSFGNTEAAAIVREQLINRIATSGKLTVVQDSSDADAVVTGTVTTDYYGRADKASIRLITRDGRTLWGNRLHANPGAAIAHAYGFGASSHVANGLAKALLKAIAQDRTGNEGKR
jgi:hypothetical protein